MSELERAIDDLARLGGERSWSLLASTDPAEFMRQVAAAIRAERARITALEAQLVRVHELQGHCAAMRAALEMPMQHGPWDMDGFFGVRGVALSGTAGRELLAAARERLRRGHDGACDCVRSERGCECGHDRLHAALNESQPPADAGKE